MNVDKFRSFFPIFNTKADSSSRLSSWDNELTPSPSTIPSRRFQLWRARPDSPVRRSLGVDVIRNPCSLHYPLIYLDSSSTAQVPLEVVEAMNQYYLSYKANVGRGVYCFAERATQEYEQARATIAKFIGAKSKEIIFTSGATAGINMIAQSWASHHLQRGDEIIISAVEHHSNFLPWQELARHLGLVVKIAPITVDGVVDFEKFTELLSHTTKLVAMVHTSNVVGGTNDIEKITQAAHSVGAAVLVDASQSIAHQAIDVGAMNIDFLVFSGHKLFGPTGTGVVYVRADRIPQMSPSSFGGGMVFSVGETESSYRPFPHGFEAGTPNVAGAIGLRAAVDFVEKNIDFSILMKHETALVQTMIAGLSQLPGIQILSFQPVADGAHAHMVTFVSDKYHAHDIAAYLDRYGIAVRAGHHCVQLFHQACNINASVRISFAGYNTLTEVDFCLQKLHELLG